MTAPKGTGSGNPVRPPIEVAPAATPEFGHLVVIAGPTCVGKSTLVSRLAAGELPGLAASLGMTDMASYEHFHATEWRRLEAASRPAVVLHFELTRPQFRAKGAGDRALRVLDYARRLSFLTLWERPDIVEQRFRAKVRGTLTDLLRDLRLRRALQRYSRFRGRQAFVTDRRRMWSLYRQWFEIAERFESSVHLVARSAAADNPMRLDAGARSTPFWESCLHETTAGGSSSTCEGL